MSGRDNLVDGERRALLISVLASSSGTSRVEGFSWVDTGLSNNVSGGDGFIGDDARLVFGPLDSQTDVGAMDTEDNAVDLHEYSLTSC